jgi:hypothetical protein
VAFVAQGTQEQENKQEEVTLETLRNTQSAWKEALKSTQPPEASVETLLMNQAQDRFKQLDCHRRVLVVALQTYQTNQLQQEIAFIEKVYNIKTKSIKALWKRLTFVVEQYREQEHQLVKATAVAVRAIQSKKEANEEKLAVDTNHFYERLKKLWDAYKLNTQLVDDTSSEANDLRVALDTLLSTPFHKTFDFAQATDLLQKHWQVVANHVEACTVVGKTPSKVDGRKAALQKNADKMLFCAKNRANVLKSAQAYRSTSEWLQALKKWDGAMKQLETEAQALRKSTGDVPAQVDSPAFCDRHSMIVAHRQWKRLVYALPPLAKRLQEREREVHTQFSNMYAVLLNKVGYELKQGLDSVLQKAQTLEREHTDLERAQVEAEEANFKLLSERFQNESRYMDMELQGYGDAANKCRELVTKLFKLKTWQEHALHLQQQLQALQPLVLSVSNYIQTPLLAAAPTPKPATAPPTLATPPTPATTTPAQN